MDIVSCYILRENTRPNDEEAENYLYECIMTLGKEFTDAFLLKGGSKLPISTAKLMQPGNVYDMIDVFIRSRNGEQYLTDTRSFEVKYIHTQSGQPPEPTCIAIVVTLDAVQIPDEAARFIERGRYWEAVSYWSDALLCYRTALKLYPGEPELLYRYGRMCMKFSERGEDARFVNNLQNVTVMAAVSGAMEAANAGQKMKALELLKSFTNLFVQNTNQIEDNILVETIAFQAEVFKKIGQYELAKLKYQDVCALAERTCPNTSETAGDYSNLSEACTLTGNHKEALEAFEQSTRHLKAAAEWPKYRKHYEDRLEELKEIARRI